MFQRANLSKHLKKRKNMKVYMIGKRVNIMTDTSIITDTAATTIIKKKQLNICFSVLMADMRFRAIRCSIRQSVVPTTITWCFDGILQRANKSGSSNILAAKTKVSRASVPTADIFLLVWV